MKMKTSNLSGAALDWAVAKANSLKIYQVWPDEIRVIDGRNWIVYSPSTDWMQGGPIIENHPMQVGSSPEHSDGTFVAYSQNGVNCKMYGSTFLIAAMRCFCVSRLGEEVEVPNEIANT